MAIEGQEPGGQYSQTPVPVQKLCNVRKCLLCQSQLGELVEFLNFGYRELSKSVSDDWILHKLIRVMTAT